MQIRYCDKCKKKIGTKSVEGKDSSIHIFGGHNFFSDKGPFELCEKCTEKFSKIIKRFLS